ncbi:DUF6090 family protein [Hwangdonia lutea]|uniref:DUF6090 family protein n=1 Tax=Hwangdonia lutea TaxID=3075823 RepID=A0AA97ELR3_9FLAO|nr:DUF6090 family protein [Hwangdonia sp. SCSIO 19198]WOD43739.1 DUF6090 family protein [Hwangdonia sp. SCSIO 19198]
MIKFFRKIRRNLLTEGNTGKYLKYAIGEIVLVVIGILIALGINNWNERKKDRDKEIVYLNRLTTNLNSDIKLYNLIIKKDSALIESLKKLQSFNFNISDKENKSTEALNALITGYHFTPNKTTIDNIVSSGNIEIIRSNYLLEDIFLYYRTTEDIQKGIDEAISNYNRSIFGPWLIKFEAKSTNEKQKNQLHNSINLKLDLLNNQMEIYNSQKIFAASLIDKISNELEISR